MCERPKQEFFQRRYTNDQKEHENMFITNHQENPNKNHTKNITSNILGKLLLKYER